MRIALIQNKAGQDRAENLRRGLQALEHAAAEGAELVCYPELAFERFYPQVPADAKSGEQAQEIPGEITRVFQELAARLGVVVVLNLFERDGERTFDTSPVIDADGRTWGRTRMVHITEYEHFHEQGYYHPGDLGAQVFATRVGRIGVAICYDRHYPEYMRALALSGAELVVVPQAGSLGEWPEGLYEAEMRVAGFQNGYFVALCNRVGEEEHLNFAGESFVCGPDGVVLARAPSGVEHTLFADLDLAEVGSSCGRRLFLRDRRPELYGDWLGDRES